MPTKFKSPKQNFEDYLLQATDREILVVLAHQILKPIWPECQMPEKIEDEQKEEK